MKKTDVLLKAFESRLNDYFQSGLDKIDIERVKKITVCKTDDFDKMQWFAKNLKLSVAIKLISVTGYWEEKRFENGLEVHFGNSKGYHRETEYNENGLEKYYEDSNGYWMRKKYENGLLIFCENSDGYWKRKKYENRLEKYYEDSNGCWRRKKYENGLLIFCEDSDGVKKEWKYNENGELIYFTNFTKGNTMKINVEYKEEK